MNIYIFPDGSIPIQISDRIFVFSTASLYFSFSSIQAITLHKGLIGAVLRWSESYECSVFYRKDEEDPVIWQWCFNKSSAEPAYTLPLDLVEESWRFFGKELVIHKTGLAEECYFAVDLDTYSTTRIDAKGRLIYFDDYVVIYSTTQKPKTIKAKLSNGDCIWEFAIGDASELTYSVDCNNGLIMVSYRETSSRHFFLDILDLNSGALQARKEFGEGLYRNLSVNDQLYFCGLKTLYRLDPKSCEFHLMYENKKGKITGFSIACDYIVLTCSDPSRVVILTLKSGGIVKEQRLDDCLVPKSVEVNSEGMMAIHFEEQEIKYLRGRDRIGILTLDELLNKEWSVKEEPELFRVDEVEDPIWGGVALEIFLDPGLAFDDLFRHAAVAIHNRAYQYGWVGVGIYAEKGKTYDERFSGKIYLNLLNYSLDEQHKSCLDELCRSLTKELRVALIRAGDRKTPITITSLMTASD